MIIKQGRDVPAFYFLPMFFPGNKSQRNDTTNDTNVLTGIDLLTRLFKRVPNYTIVSFRIILYKK